MTNRLLKLVWARILESDEEEHEEEDSDSDSAGLLFNIAICTIFAREFLEGAVIIGNYRTVILRSDQWQHDDDGGDAQRKQALRTVTVSAALASAVAIFVVLVVGVVLGILSNDLDDRTVEIIEGFSKIVASICIIQLSVKIPVWLGLYEKVSIFPCRNKNKATDTTTDSKDLPDITMTELRFNVAWNIWREVAECGVFLIPFFLGTGAEAIPLSALVGIFVALFIGLGIYWANQRLSNKVWLAVFMSGLTLFLAVGLFVGACHEFEEVWGETAVVWEAEKDFWDHSKFPFVIVKPFGYSSERTVLQICAFWLFLAAGLTLHILKWNATRLVRKARAAAAMEQPQEQKAGENNSQDDTHVAEEVIDDEKPASKAALGRSDSTKELSSEEDETGDEITTNA
ncbi:hypothetical protein ACA910_000699 [Epithemia clementina (nom. ined.)]